jgi:hypothetical protein
MTAPKLKIVSAEPVLDIGSLIRADILKRDWTACHIAGDRRKPVEIEDRRKGSWR